MAAGRVTRGGVAAVTTGVGTVHSVVAVSTTWKADRGRVKTSHTFHGRSKVDESLLRVYISTVCQQVGLMCCVVILSLGYSRFRNHLLFVSEVRASCFNSGLQFVWLRGQYYLEKGTVFMLVVHYLNIN